MDGEYWLAIIVPCDLDWGGFHGFENMDGAWFLANE